MNRSDAELVAKIAGQVCRDHHDAFLVQLVGGKGSNLGVQRIADLIKRGVLEEEDLNKVLVPGAGCDYIEFIFHVSDFVRKNQEDLAKLAEMREWGINKWTGIVADRVNELKDEPVGIYPVQGGVEIALPGVIPKPTPPSTTGKPVTPEASKGLRDFEAHGHHQAMRYAGLYARGLGQELAHDMEQVVQEEWDKEDIITEVDPELRARKLKVIQEETAREFTESKDYRSLTRKLAEKTGEYARNWERIARTELQAVYNDARVISGVKDFGSGTQIARIHESNACEDCKRLCGPSQNPVVFSVQELFQNGTNVGKRRQDWSATIFPIHPNCRCDTVIVPPGFTIEDGNMVRKKDE